MSKNTFYILLALGLVGAWLYWSNSKPKSKLPVARDQSLSDAGLA